MEQNKEKTAQKLLEDEFLDTIGVNFAQVYEHGIVPTEDINNAADISAELAKQIALEFALWIAKYIYPYEIIANSTEELFELFIKEKYKE